MKHCPDKQVSSSIVLTSNSFTSKFAHGGADDAAGNSRGICVGNSRGICANDVAKWGVSGALRPRRPTRPIGVGRIGIAIGRVG